MGDVFHVLRPSCVALQLDQVVDGAHWNRDAADVHFHRALRKLLIRYRFMHKQIDEEKINVQRDGGKAKPYQIRQVRAVILRYKLRGNDDVQV